jgi:hypothetical protein
MRRGCRRRTPGSPPLVCVVSQRDASHQPWAPRRGQQKPVPGTPSRAGPWPARTQALEAGVPSRTTVRVRRRRGRIASRRRARLDRPAAYFIESGWGQGHEPVHRSRPGRPSCGSGPPAPGLGRAPRHTQQFEAPPPGLSDRQAVAPSHSNPRALRLRRSGPIASLEASSAAAKTIRGGAQARPRLSEPTSSGAQAVATIRAGSRGTGGDRAGSVPKNRRGRGRSQRRPFSAGA